MWSVGSPLIASCPTASAPDQFKNPFVYEEKSNDGAVAPRSAADLARIQDKYFAMCAQAGRKCRFQAVEFPWNGGAIGIGDALCRVALLNNARNLVLGFRGLTTAERLAMGSVSSRCVQACELTTTVVKPPARTRF